MASWEELEKSARELGKSIEVVALAGVAGSWLDENFAAFKTEASRWNIPADEFLLGLLMKAILDSQSLSQLDIDKVNAKVDGDDKPVHQG